MYLTHLLDHVEYLATRLQKNSRYIEDSLTLRFSSIISLTTLAQIGHTLARESPGAVAFRNQRNDALRRVLLHVGELSSDEFRTIDTFLGVSSSRTIPV